MTTRHTVIWAVGVIGPLLLAGCVSAPMQRLVGATDTPLYAWVDRELAPYLAEELTRHPRFKNEPVLIVAMAGADVRPEIDALTHEVRERLMDQLLHTPGVNLVWRPTQAPWQHHRTPPALPCGASTAHYYVGIEITPTTGNEYRLSVRALDMREQAWVSGFGKTWYGSLPTPQRSALAEGVPDEYLRGLRVLPFADTEPDLLAAYLAQNVGCLLNAQGAQGSAVYIEPTGKGSSPQTKVVELVRHYLDRQQQLRVTDTHDAADLVLTVTVNEVHRGLHQVWLRVKPRQGSESIRTTATDAYVQLSAGTESARRAVYVDPGKLSAPRREALLSRLRLLMPRNPQRCGTGNPWADGSRVAAGHSAIDAGECFALTFDLARDAHVFLLTHRADGEFSRLLPHGCGNGPDPGNPIAGGTTLQFPAAGHDPAAALPWAGAQALESFYAIAVTDTAAAWRLAEHMGRLPDACGDVSRAHLDESELNAWLARLDALMRQFDGRADWQALRVQHR